MSHRNNKTKKVSRNNPSIVDYLNGQGQASDYNSRATLAGQQGIQNYTGTAQQNTQLLNQLRQPTQALPPVATLPSTPAPTTTVPPLNQNLGTVPIDSLNTPPSAINLPDNSVPQPTTAPVDVGQLATNYADLFKQDSALQDKLAKEQAVFQGLTGKSLSQEQRRAQLEQIGGVGAKRAQVQDLVSQLRNMNTQAKIADLNTQDRLAPMFAITGEQAAIERQRTVKALGTSAQIEAMQGNISSALDLVDRQIQAEFVPLQAQLEVSRQRLEAIRGQIKTDTSVRGKAVLLALDEKARQVRTQEKQLEVWKSDRKDIQLLALNAAQNGADTLTLKAIQEAGSIEEAIQRGGTLVLDPKDLLEQQKVKQKMKLDIIGQKLDVAKLKIENKKKSGGGSSTTKVTATQLKQFINQQIASTEFQALSQEDKQLYIRSQGGDPYNFGF